MAVAAVAVGGSTAPASAETAAWQRLPVPGTQQVKTEVVMFQDGKGIATTLNDTTWCADCTVVRSHWRWNGTAWSKYTIPAAVPAQYIAGWAADDTWVFGRSSASGYLAHHWDGATWTERSPNPLLFETVKAKSPGPNQVWAMGWDRSSNSSLPPAMAYYNGSSWRIDLLPQPTGTSVTLTNMHVAAANDVWVVGTACRTGTAADRCQPYGMHWNGVGWASVALPTFSPWSGGAASVVSRGGEVWIGGQEQDRSSATPTRQPRAFTAHRVGSSWTTTFVPGTSPGSTSTGSVGSLAFRGSELWAGLWSDPALMRWNGTGWVAVDGPLWKTRTATVQTSPTGGILVNGAGWTSSTDYFGTEYLAHLPAA